MSSVLDVKNVAAWEEKFFSDPMKQLAQNACAKATTPGEAFTNRNLVAISNTVFSHNVEPVGKPQTNQHVSGRCWIFAFLNAMRVPLMRHLNVEELELSQSHMFYCDKVERSHYMLRAVVELAKRGEAVESRAFQHILGAIKGDGGQWHMAKDIVNKYGVMPKQVFSDTESCRNSRLLNKSLHTKIAEYARELRVLVEKKASDQEIDTAIDRMMEQLHSIISVCLGVPPREFTFEYTDKDKKYHKIGPITPLEFYEKHVKPVFNPDDKICLVNDTRRENAFGKLYTVDLLGNVWKGSSTSVEYNNQPIDLIKTALIESIKNNEVVWFGCDFDHMIAAKSGVIGLNAFRYDLMFGGDEKMMALSKEERLRYGEAFMTHAMAFNGVTIDESNNPVKFKVENSWGEDYGFKGTFVMWDDWFDEFVFEVCIDKKYLSTEVLAVMEQKPIVLPPWDPMGSVAATNM